MLQNKVNLFLLLAIIIIAGCKKYPDFYKDYDYTTVYFSSQKPLRTIVAYDTMQFKLGVVLGGVLNNNQTHVVDYAIDPSLLTTVTGASVFKLLPPDYYSISDPSKIIIQKGKMVGDVTITLNRQKFTDDPNAINNYYALPLKIVSSTTDSVLRGSEVISAKDYTILVVKYISPYSGFYYQKGQQTNLTTNAVTIYTNKDISKLLGWQINTIDANSVLTGAAGTNTAGKMRLDVDNANNVIVSSGSLNVTNVTGSGIFDTVNRQFYLDYTYTLAAVNYSVKDTLIQRLPPEKDLRYQEW